MSEHTPTFTIDLSELPDSLALLQRFYEANGYAFDDSGALPAFHRGKAGAGWYSSDMSQLQTTVVVQKSPESIQLQYRVDVKGQRLSDEDKAFWQKEARSAEKFLRHPDRSPDDLRPGEAQRAEDVREDLRRRGLWAATLIFLLILTVGILSERLGIHLF